mgnify:CR=1 FL=1
MTTFYDLAGWGTRRPFLNELRSVNELVQETKSELDAEKGDKKHGKKSKGDMLTTVKTLKKDVAKIVRKSNRTTRGMGKLEQRVELMSRQLEALLEHFEVDPVELSGDEDEDEDAAEDESEDESEDDESEGDESEETAS